MTQRVEQGNAVRAGQGKVTLHLMISPDDAAFRPPSAVRPSLGGFSLLELLAAAAVMMLLMGLAFPAISGLKSSNDFRGGLQQIKMAFEQARTRAVSRSTFTWVRVEAQPAALQLTLEESLTGSSQRLPGDLAPLHKPVLLNMQPASEEQLRRLESGRTEDLEKLALPVQFMFSPDGTVRIGDSSVITRSAEFGVCPLGSNARNTAVIQVSGMRGNIDIIRP